MSRVSFRSFDLNGSTQSGTAVLCWNAAAAWAPGSRSPAMQICSALFGCV